MWPFRKHPEIDILLDGEKASVKLVCKKPKHAKALHDLLKSLEEADKPCNQLHEGFDKP